MDATGRLLSFSEQVPDMKKVFEYRKGRCFGELGVYSLKDDDGTYYVDVFLDDWEYLIICLYFRLFVIFLNALFCVEVQHWFVCRTAPQMF